MTSSEKEYYEGLIEKYRSILISPQMKEDKFKQFLIKKYHLIPTTVEHIGLQEMFDNYFDWISENRLKPFCERAGIEYDPNDLKFELFESDIPAHNVGFLFYPHGRRINWSTTYLIYENKTGFVYSNYEMYSIEAMYVKGVNQNDIESLTQYARRYLDNLEYLRKGIIDQFHEIIERDFINLQKQIEFNIE